MNSETKQCQNCKTDFVIESEDFSFYEKIKVPPPTFCPECRLIRRLAWRNEQTLYKRACGLCEKNTFSTYSEKTPFVVYCQQCWWSDKWDPLVYGREYDFNRSFFTQFDELHRHVPLPALWGFNNENCDFANYIGYSKNCYFSFSIVSSEEIYYSGGVDRSKNCFDSYIVQDSEFCYENSNSAKNYQSMYLDDSKENLASAFLYDCSNCQNCFMSRGLRNRQFVFRGEQYSREEYAKKITEELNGRYTRLRELVAEFQELKQRGIHKFARILKSENCTGDAINESRNVGNSFRIQESENIKYCWRLVKYKDAHDVSGAITSEMMYEAVVAASHNYFGKFFVQVKESNNFAYSMHGSSVSNVFGCVGAQDKQYCILNKQYSKEEYEELVPKIIKHMNDMPYVDAKGRTYTYGEFFPPELSPFAYNETIAQEYFPLTKEEALAKGYKWRDQDTKDYKITTKPEDLPDHIKDVPDSITKEIIECSHVRVNPRTNLRESACQEQCTTAFKIIPQELQFYRQMNLPLPRLCPNCRHYERLKQRNPLKLWHRQCECEGQMAKKKGDNQYANTATHAHGDTPCPTEFETSYAPERQEIVYCEQCYNAEVA